MIKLAMASSYDHEEEQCTCPIHLDILQDPVALPYCGHWFCRGCIRDHVKNTPSTDPDCPKCRLPLDLPPGGIDTLMVNHDMREICRRLEDKRSAKAGILTCTKHADEHLNRFCCECLYAVCEECADEDHHGHKCRSLGSAWKIVGHIIEEKFRIAREILEYNQKHYAESARRNSLIIEQSVHARTLIIRLRDQLYSIIEESSEKLIEQVTDHVDRSCIHEEQLTVASSENPPTLQDIDNSERILSKMLSSKNSHCLNVCDQNAITTLHNLAGIARRELPGEIHPVEFRPSDISSRLSSEGLGKILTGDSIQQPCQIGGERCVQIMDSNQFTKADGAKAHPEPDQRLLTPLDKVIRSIRRIILPNSVSQPFDVQQYLQDDIFADNYIVADTSGAVTLITGIETMQIRSHTLKRSPGDFFSGPAGVTLCNSIFVCNHSEKHVEQLDAQRVTCVRTIGDDTVLTSPRAITHSIAKRALYVSDLNGGVKVFDSNSGLFIGKIGDEMLLSPLGLATNRQSHLYVCDELQGNIYIFDTRMASKPPVKVIETSCNGRRSHCYGVGLDSDGHVWATMTSAHSPLTSALVEFDSSGELLRSGGIELMKPRGLRVSNKQVVVADAQEHCIVTYE